MRSPITPNTPAFFSAVRPSSGGGEMNPEEDVHPGV
jgi:hypothetical protein